VPVTGPRFSLGALQLDPRLAIRNVGIDTNVFNTPTAPERDFTATIGPELESRLQAGRLTLTGTSGFGWTYFQKASSQRFVEYAQAGRADVALVRVTPHVEGSVERTRRRPNDELDVRVRQRRTRMGGGLAVHPGARLTVDATFQERTFDFGDGSADDFGLSQSLNRTERELGLATSLALTPLTTFVVRTASREDDFEFAGERNSRSISVMSGLEFKPLALISGQVFIGFRSFAPKTSELPGFNGVIAAVDLQYVARDFLRVDIDVARDVDYSFERDRPYFVSTSLRGEVSQAIGGSWDIVGRAGTTRLAYQAFDRAGAPTDTRADRLWLGGIGLGRRMGVVRIGVDVDRVTRNSSVEGRRYSGLRAGGSLTYGY
jgi:hypothetical protein